MTPEMLTEWVNGAGDAPTRELRQAVHTVLAAVSTAPRLSRLVALKGGILLALAHEGDRFTRDVDFSVRETVRELPPDAVVEEIRVALARQVEVLDYGLDCRIQAHELRPPDEARSFQTLQLNVGYAPKGDAARQARLQRGRAVEVLRVDVSYNEVVTAVEVAAIPGGATLNLCAPADLVAEKLRAVLQQPIRDRVRRQDVYDLYRILARGEFTDRRLGAAVHAALIVKCEGRGLAPRRDSLQDPEVRRRSEQEYAQLQAEIASKLPAFDEAYARVQAFYEGLPWT